MPIQKKHATPRVPRQRVESVPGGKLSVGRMGKL
mgnify:CR=1 FL=1